MTTARLTSAQNCSLRLGEIVDSASSGLDDAEHDHAGDRRAHAVHLREEGREHALVGRRLAGLAIVNCQPSSEPRQAMIASTMMIEPTDGLNMWA